MLLSRVLTTLVKDITAGARVMQSFSNELSTPVSSSEKCEKKK